MNSVKKLIIYKKLISISFKLILKLAKIQSDILRTTRPGDLYFFANMKLGWLLITDLNGSRDVSQNNHNLKEPFVYNCPN